MTSLQTLCLLLNLMGTYIWAFFVLAVVCVCGRDTPCTQLELDPKLHNAIQFILV